jgi:hypothetical protein
MHTHTRTHTHTHARTYTHTRTHTDTHTHTHTPTCFLPYTHTHTDTRTHTHTRARARPSARTDEYRRLLRATSTRRAPRPHGAPGPSAPSARPTAPPTSWNWARRTASAAERGLHTCATTGLTPATSAPGLGSPLPHLRRDWAHPCPHLHRDWARPSAIHSSNITRYRRRDVHAACAHNGPGNPTCERTSKQASKQASKQLANPNKQTKRPNRWRDGRRLGGRRWASLREHHAWSDARRRSGGGG